MSDLDDMKEAMKALALLASSHVELRDEHDPCDDCGAEGGKPCDEDCGRAANERTVRDGVDAIAEVVEELKKVIKERDHWRSNHDNQLEIKNAVLQRPDLGDRARVVQDLIADRDAALAKLAAAEKDAAEWKESSRWWQEQASVIHLERDRLECDDLRSALGAAEKRANALEEDGHVRSRLVVCQKCTGSGMLSWIESSGECMARLECGNCGAHGKVVRDIQAESERDAALAKLAEAERDCAGHKERIHELSDELGACEKEREEARAKLAEARSEAGCAKAWRDAITAEGRRIGIALGIYRDESEAANSVLEGSESKTWRTILWYCKRYGEVLKERDRLSAQLAEAREALAKIAGLDYRNAATNGAAYSAHQIASAFLAPPSDQQPKE